MDLGHGIGAGRLKPDGAFREGLRGLAARVKDSEWFHGDTYLFAYDLKGNVLLNPAFPARQGTNVSGQMDANGKLFHDAIIRTAETSGSGWVDYMFPKPGQTQPSQKWAFLKAVKIDGVPGLVASAFTPNRRIRSPAVGRIRPKRSPNSVLASVVFFST